MGEGREGGGREKVERRKGRKGKREGKGWVGDRGRKRERVGGRVEGERRERR